LAANTDSAQRVGRPHVGDKEFEVAVVPQSGKYSSVFAARSQCLRAKCRS